MTFLMYLSVTLYVIVCVFLILLVLIQKGRGGGLASAFGGGGGNTAFGSKTGDVLTWATSIIFGIFIALAVVLNLLAEKKSVAAAPPMLPLTTAAPTNPEPTSPPPLPAAEVPSET